MSYRPRGYARATIGGPGAVVVREVLAKGDRALLEAYAARVVAAEDPDTRWAGRGVLEFLAELDDAAHRWTRRQDDEIGSTSASGRPDIEGGGVAAQSVVDLDGPWLGVGEVATRLVCTRRHVRRLCELGGVAGGLVATKPGRDWHILEWSVTAYELARRPVA